MSLFGKPSVAKLKAKGDRDGLVKALSMPDPKVRRTAAEALSSLGWSPQTDEQRLDFLVASGSWGEITELGRAKPQLLVERFLNEARQHLGKKVELPGIPVRFVGGGVTPDYDGQLDEPSTPTGTDIRCLFVSAFRDIGEPAVAPLVAALDDEDADRSSHASWALIEIGEAALDPLIARYMPIWSDGSLSATSVATTALAAKRSRERGGQGFVSHLHRYVGRGGFEVPGFVASLAGERDEYAAWQDEVVDSSPEDVPESYDGRCCTVAEAEQALSEQNPEEQTQPDSRSRQEQVEAGRGRRGDGTILGDLISKGLYKPQAGSEKIGYFDPETAPFRDFPNGKTGLLQGPLADELIQAIPARREAFGDMLDGSGDLAVDLAIKLELSSTRQVMDVFLQLVNDKAVGQFLLVTTTMPFFLTYITGKRVIVAEVYHELKLNALANLLLTDPSFASIHSVSAFEAEAASLLDKRKGEVEEKKQWAIDVQKSGGA